MTGDDLTPEQLAWFQVINGRRRRLYERVRARMERRAGARTTGFVATRAGAGSGERA
jgi:hypothetical protein